MEINNLIVNVNECVDDVSGQSGDEVFRQAIDDIQRVEKALLIQNGVDLNDPLGKLEGQFLKLEAYRAADEIMSDPSKEALISRKRDHIKASYSFGALEEEKITTLTWLCIALCFLDHMSKQG